jgi:hypothetical protein
MHFDVADELFRGSYYQDVMVLKTDMKLLLSSQKRE